MRRVRWLGDDRNAFLGEELLHKRYSVRYRDAETTLPATCRAISSELQFLAEKSILVITQPSYSPHLAQSDFWLFPTPGAN